MNILIAYILSLVLLNTIGNSAGLTRGVEGANPTFFFDVTGGFSTHKSELVENNDTTTSFGYSFGGTAGANSNLGFFIRSDTMATPFELNSSQITTTWQDSGLKYRLGFFYFGLVLSSVETTVNDEGVDLIDAGGTGAGGTTGFQFSIGKTAVMYLDITSVTIATTRNELDQTTAVGARQDVDIGAYIDLSKRSFDYMIGYKQRTVAITTDASYIDTITTTYVGFRWASYF